MCDFKQLSNGLAGGMQQMAKAGDRVDYGNGTFESIGPNPPPGGMPANDPNWMKMLPPADAQPGAPMRPPEYWRRLPPGFATS